MTYDYHEYHRIIIYKSKHWLSTSVRSKSKNVYSRLHRRLISHQNLFIRNLSTIPPPRNSRLKLKRKWNRDLLQSPT
ncbi:Uncharacterized protein FWK35_00032692 [Aphis craccivora]|uniref:Uncharacterized protein n=1 Tax=Aphis craccivora TaxID=307492 RepID=A0A6G0YR27_APHCR|nr:Uncharacterized protein FWK35_00032692 [Aphis craccivora]